MFNRRNTPDALGEDVFGFRRSVDLAIKERLADGLRGKGRLDTPAFVATGVERAVPGIMTQGITAGLSDGEVDAPVAFLLDQ